MVHDEADRNKAIEVLRELTYGNVGWDRLAPRSRARVEREVDALIAAGLLVPASPESGVDKEPVRSKPWLSEYDGKRYETEQKPVWDNGYYYTRFVPEDAASASPTPETSNEVSDDAPVSRADLAHLAFDGSQANRSELFRKITETGETP